MNNMSKKEYINTIEETFGELLRPEGFTTEDSKHGVFYKKISDEVFHFIMPDRSLRMPKYDIKVFPHSPLLDDEFYQKLPDEVGVITNEASYLSSNGFTMHQEWYWCKTKEGLVRNFNKKVKPSLIKYALPYLTKFKSINDFNNLKLGKVMEERLTCLNINA